MAGLYLHIPFCKQACYYCDFHFSTNTGQKQETIKAIAKELQLQKPYLKGESLQSIYFGGGTPSLLSAEELNLLLDTIYKYFSVDTSVEITLEANPDDLSPSNLKVFKSCGVNRLSIGIQSFNNYNLKFLNRAHSAEEALISVENARRAGFDNLNLDLIYAIPATGQTVWERDLETIQQLRPEHISSYCLTIENKTVFGNWLKKGKIQPIDEERAASDFELLIHHLKEDGYQQYEISNFCLPNKHSRHNSNYWKQEKYLGVGPSAHSFDGKNRQFNASNNVTYIKSLKQNKIPFELDILGPTERLNEYILTTLRTSWGCNLEKLKKDFQYDLLKDQKEYLNDLITGKMAFIDQENHLKLTDKGKLLADKITLDLFIS
ncbi:radical SAM family heme chaperone HemW [Xanthovirga aplysinae]|uniref:radical SAM family heme chaperone HemW n=1 Tax=Xanthovirga aplysinae TaxID=2529853 RepID=UPI0012BD2751|nr:radical SAM family heme chaperone HemW [Xanthovirga aplysinae]MTI33318.1 radical SAM family heme chaperone HemW [Xanthovirga aplysinae]